MILSDKFNAKNLEKTLGKESKRKGKEEICLGYSTKYKIVCERCGNPYNKYCPFYISTRTKSLL